MVELSCHLLTMGPGSEMGMIPEYSRHLPQKMSQVEVRAVDVPHRRQLFVHFAEIQRHRRPTMAEPWGLDPLGSLKGILKFLVAWMVKSWLDVSYIIYIYTSYIYTSYIYIYTPYIYTHHIYHIYHIFILSIIYHVWCIMYNITSSRSQNCWAGQWILLQRHGESRFGIPNLGNSNPHERRKRQYAVMIQCGAPKIAKLVYNYNN